MNRPSPIIDRAARFDWRYSTYGLARSLIAFATCTALVATPTGALFAPVLGRPQAPNCDGVLAISGFCLGPASVTLDVRRLLLAALLIPTIIGWRPRLFGVLHWWVTFSFASSIALPDGGDSVALILSAFLIPLALADGRRWHWRRNGTEKQLTPWVAAFCYVSWVTLRIQVAGIYFDSAVAKFGVAQWADGTALYYWLNNHTFGLYRPLLYLARPLLANGMFVGIATWGVLLSELALAFAIFWPQRIRSRIFWIGIALHAGIALFMGLFSFALAMFGALILALRPIDQQWSVSGLRSMLARLRGPGLPAEPVSATSATQIDQETHGALV